MFVIAYLDDILVYSRIIKEYRLYVSKILIFLEVKDLYSKLEKYKFY